MANAKSIEAIAIIRGLQICMHQGISKLIIEIDHFVEVEKLFSRGNSNLDIINVMLDIKELMSRFVFCKVQYGNCQCNMAVHILVKNTRHVNNIAFGML